MNLFPSSGTPQICPDASTERKSSHLRPSGPPQAFDKKSRRRPKILFYFLDLGIMGGIGQFILQTALALKQRGHFEPVILCSEGTPFFHQLQQSGFNVFGIPLPAHLPKSLFQYYSKPLMRLFDLPLVFQLKKILEREKPDLVHVHMGRLENLWFKKMGYPLIYSFHGYASPFNIGDTPRVLDRWFIRASRPLFSWLVPHLDALLFVSRSERSRLHREGFLPKTFSGGEVVHNGLPIQEIHLRACQTDREALKRSLGIPVEARCVSFINRVDKFKNPLLFVKLAERLAQVPGLQPLRFLIAGSGHLDAKLAEAVRSSPASRQFHILGFRSDVPELLAISDLSVYIPQMEGFGLSVLEAIATGTLCLAFATGGIPEILDIPEGQFMLVPPGDFDGLVHQAIALLQLPEDDRRILSERLHQRALDFDISLLVDRLEGIYDRTLARD